MIPITRLRHSSTSAVYNIRFLFGQLDPCAQLIAYMLFICSISLAILPYCSLYAIFRS